MSRLLHWSLLLGCVGVSALTLRPAWDIACCPAPLAELSSSGWAVRPIVSVATPTKGPVEASSVEGEQRSTEDLALADPR